VRREEAGEGDDDQVVEEEHPAGHEAERIVERTADEGGGAAGLRDRGGAFGVREGHEQEEGADEEEDERCETERVERDDAEGEVERGADLAVGDGCERRGPEGALEAEFLRHYAVLRTK
jgi:hypothetical protein